MAAAAEAAKLATKRTAHPPASPFAELLRHSRFGSFDPQIRQTYYSPPENVSRGDWGLKRPLTLRRKDAHITLKEYEHRAFFVEWSRGDAQANFIKKLDEANVTPRLPANDEDGITWLAQLGKKKSQWLIDSEYCPEDEEAAAYGVAPQYVEWDSKEFTQEFFGEDKLPSTSLAEDEPVESMYDANGMKGIENVQDTELMSDAEVIENMSMEDMEDMENMGIEDMENMGMEDSEGIDMEAAEALEGLEDMEDVEDVLNFPEFRGRRYGAQRPLPPPKQEEWQVNDFVQPNIYSMSPRQFKAYIKRMRKLRPQFLKWLKKHAEINPQLVGKRISDLHNDALTLHREFLSEYWKKQYNDPSSVRMEPQPHTFGGLSYARMSDLDSTFSRRYEPGIILHEDRTLDVDQQDINELKERIDELEALGPDPDIDTQVAYILSAPDDPVESAIVDAEVSNDEEDIEEFIDEVYEDGVEDVKLPDELQEKLDPAEDELREKLEDELMEADAERELRVPPPYVVSFSGLTTVLHTGEKPDHVIPLIDDRTAATIDPSRAEGATASMTFGPGSLVLYKPPRVVGPYAEGLKGVQIAADVIINPIEYQRSDDMQKKATKNFPEEVKDLLKADVKEYQELMRRTEDMADSVPYVGAVLEILEEKMSMLQNEGILKPDPAKKDDVDDDDDMDGDGRGKKVSILDKLTLMIGDEKDGNSSGPHGL